MIRWVLTAVCVGSGCQDTDFLDTAEPTTHLQECFPEGTDTDTSTPDDVVVDELPDLLNTQSTINVSLRGQSNCSGALGATSVLRGPQWSQSIYNVTTTLLQDDEHCVVRFSVFIDPPTLAPEPPSLRICQPVFVHPAADTYRRTGGILSRFDVQSTNLWPAMPPLRWQRTSQTADIGECSTLEYSRTETVLIQSELRIPIQTWRAFELSHGGSSVIFSLSIPVIAGT